MSSACLRPVAQRFSSLIHRDVLTIRSRFGVQFARMKTYFDGLARDFRYALRSLRKNRRFSLIAIFALALGIGASTVVFSVVYNSISLLSLFCAVRIPPATVS